MSSETQPKPLKLLGIKKRTDISIGISLQAIETYINSDQYLSGLEWLTQSVSVDMSVLTIYISSSKPNTQVAYNGKFAGGHE